MYNRYVAYILIYTINRLLYLIDIYKFILVKIIYIIKNEKYITILQKKPFNISMNFYRYII